MIDPTQTGQGRNLHEERQGTFWQSQENMNSPICQFPKPGHESIYAKLFSHANNVQQVHTEMLSDGFVFRRMKGKMEQHGKFVNINA